MNEQKSRFRKRRTGAISEIISAVLLVSLTIVISTIVLAFATTALGSSSINFSNLVGNANGALSTQLSMEQVTFPQNVQTPYVIITISNTQSKATPSPFQQEVVINPSLYTSYESTDLGNVRFYLTLSGSTFSNTLDSWLEAPSSTPANAATSATFWLSIPSGIAANSGISVYMVFLSSGTEFDGVVAGEAPELSSTYGQYDNGANLFSLYGGLSWTTFSAQGGGTWTTSNGYLQQTASSGGGTQGGPTYVYTGSTYSATGSYVLESMLSYPSVSSGNNPRVGLIAVATPSGGDSFGYRFLFQQSSNGAGALSFLNDEKAWVANNGYQTSTNTNYVVSVSDNAGIWSGTVFQGNSVISTSVTTLSSTTYSSSNYQGSTSGYVGISASVYTGSSTEANPLSVYWFRMRAMPPNGVMPSTSSGSAQGSQSQITNLYVRNTGQNLASVVAVYVNNVTTAAVLNSTQFNPAISINPGSFVRIQIQYVVKFGATYSFLVVTSTGYEVGVNAQA